MTHDPAYLAKVSTELLGVLREAQDMVHAGERGESLADAVRHARELHDIMIEEIGSPSDAIGEHASYALMEMGDRLRWLEKTVAGF